VRPAKLLWASIPLTLILLGLAAILAIAPPRVDGSATNMATTPRHPVTPEMEESAGAVAGRPAPSFVLKSTKDEMVASQELLKKGPVVVVMTKDGCPCSIESQPYFNQIHASYKDVATFVGVIDADIPVAQLYAGSLSVPYPLLVETKEKTFRDFGADQSVYTYLIGRDGKLIRVWPGYSAKTLIELNEAVAEAAGVKPRAITLKNAPAVMTSGCYFFK
jgi:peroxiredoxin